MTKIKKRTSRFFVEQDHLYETSDFGSSTVKKNRKKMSKQELALASEQESHQKIIAVNAPVAELINNEEDSPTDELRDKWMSKTA